LFEISKNINFQEITKELEALEKAHLEQKTVGSISIKTLLTDPQYLKPFAIANFLMFMQQFCGINVIIFYSQTIFQKAGSTLDPGIIFIARLASLELIKGTLFLAVCFVVNPRWETNPECREIIPA